jgi:hypothetical protein
MKPDVASSRVTSLFKVCGQLQSCVAPPQPLASLLCAMVLELKVLAMVWICGVGVLLCPR